MGYYSGLDVSLEATFISIVDKDGKIIKEESVVTDAVEIAKFLKEQKLEYEKIGIESGQLSISLCKGLAKEGIKTICVDARHMSKLLSAKINKNDKNDARGIAQMMRANLYKEVTIKSDEVCQIKMLLGSRRHLVSARQEMSVTIRGLLKIYGVKINGSYNKLFKQKVTSVIKDFDETSKASIEALLHGLKGIEESISELDSRLVKLGKEDEDCKLLTTIPGVGVITAMTYKSSLDAPGRFENSEEVGAYMGLTPRQYASGEIDRHGSISKMGPKFCRTALYEAAQSIICVSKKQTKLKNWGMKLLKKKGAKKAIVAVARKLAVIMHRMLIDRTEFNFA